MTVGILTVGDEIVGGHVADTNSTYLTRQLGEIGFGVRRTVTVGDDGRHIADALASLLADCDLVFITGGLGPTDDDITKEAVASAAGLSLRVDDGLLRRLEARYAGDPRARPEIIRRLATVPEGARLLENPVGAAAGMVLVCEAKRIYVLPGVPAEMEAIFETCIVADLESLPMRDFARSRVLRTTGLRESEIDRRIGATPLGRGVRLGYLPTLTGVDLRLTAVGASGNEATAALNETAAKIAGVLGDFVHSDRGADLEAVVAGMLIEAKTTLAVAESCTGGLIGHLLTEVPGISACLDRCVVAYSNKAKMEVLSVGRDLLDRHGAVSPEVAEAMACGVRELAGTDLGLSTTGIAGPGGGSAEKPVGLVYTAVAYAGGCTVDRSVFRGTRHAVKIRAATHALDMVRYRLLRTGG
jgi:nicotinamide-nucleotide amidase